MEIPFTTAAYVGVVAAAVTLFAIGHRTAEPPLSATTPGLVKVAAPPPGAVAAGGFTLSSTSVDLPTSDRDFPPGPGLAAMQGNCVACHSAGMVMNQPALARATWEGEVNKMRAVYKAPVAAEDVPTIVDYLVSVKGAR